MYFQTHRPSPVVPGGTGGLGNGRVQDTLMLETIQLRAQPPGPKPRRKRSHGPGTWTCAGPFHILSIVPRGCPGGRLSSKIFISDACPFPTPSVGSPKKGIVMMIPWISTCTDMSATAGSLMASPLAKDHALVDQLCNCHSRFCKILNITWQVKASHYDLQRLVSALVFGPPWSLQAPYIVRRFSMLWETLAFPTTPWIASARRLPRLTVTPYPLRNGMWVAYHFTMTVVVLESKMTPA